MSFRSFALKMLLICVLCSSGSTSTCPKAKVQGTFIKNGKSMVRGVEGKNLTIVCNVQSDKPAEKFVLRIKGSKLKRSGSGNLTYSFIPSQFDNMKSFGCSVLSAFLVTPLSCEVLLDIQYSPIVTIIQEVTEKKLTLICNPSGNPKNYTFADWEHYSAFYEHIRNVQGTSDGTLTFLDSNNNNKLHENDGIYKCKTSNGIYGTNGNLYQKGLTLINDKVPPVFVNANHPIQFGHYRQKMNLTVLLYNSYGALLTTISKQNETLNADGRQAMIRTHDIFHGVNVTVSGIKVTFQLTLMHIEDFTDYTIKACNEKGCNGFTVKVKSNEPTINIYRVKAVFVLLLIVIAVVLSKDVSLVVLLVLAVTLAVYGLITFFFLRGKEKDASDNYIPREEEVRENFQEPVDNQLYISSDDPDLARVHSLRTQSEIDTTLPSTSYDNQIYQMQLHNEGGDL